MKRTEVGGAGQVVLGLEAIFDSEIPEACVPWLVKAAML